MRPDVHLGSESQQGLQGEDLPGDRHKVRSTERRELRESVQPAAELLQYACITHGVERPGMDAEPQGLAGP